MVQDNSLEMFRIANKNFPYFCADNPWIWLRIKNDNAKQTNNQNAKYAEEANQGDVKGFVGTRHPNIDAFCSRPPNPNPPLPHNILINNDTVATHFKKEHLNTSLKQLLHSYGNPVRVKGNHPIWRLMPTILFHMHPHSLCLNRWILTVVAFILHCVQ